MIIEYRKPTFTMRLSRWILGLFGWKVILNIPKTKKFVAVGAWHTSNIDFFLAVLAAGAMGLPLKFIGKQALVDGKLGWLMKRLGVIGVDRSKSNNVVEQIAKKFEKSEELYLVVPAEGTRSKAEYWKTGFYYMALAAKVPIAFGTLDASKKEVGIFGWIEPTGNREEDFAKIIDYFKDKRGLKPQNQAEIKFRPERKLQSKDDSELKMPEINSELEKVQNKLD